MRMKLWTRPRDYFGAEWPEHYAFLGQHRESDSVTRSNFIVAQERLGAIPEPTAWPHDSAPWEVVRESHWAVGWVEWIAIHRDAAEHIAAAEAMLSEIEDYPLLSEDHHSELQWNEASKWWGRMSLRDRINAIRASRCGASLFAARRGYIPQDDDGRLFEYLTSE